MKKEGDVNEEETIGTKGREQETRIPQRGKIKGIQKTKASSYGEDVTT